MKKSSLNSDQAHKDLVPKKFLDPKCGPLVVFVGHMWGMAEIPRKKGPW